MGYAQDKPQDDMRLSRFLSFAARSYPPLPTANC